MQLPLRPLSTLPSRDPRPIAIRLPSGQVVDLVLFDGNGHVRSVCVWTLRGRALHFVLAGEA